jgi:hypothetical protein
LYGLLDKMFLVCWLTVGRTALTQQKRIAAEYLEENYQRFFSHYTRQLDSANYATKRQFLKLLSDILLDRYRNLPSAMCTHSI